MHTVSHILLNFVLWWLFLYSISVVCNVITVMKICWKMTVGCWIFCQRER